jgi:TP901 family phage tail tape measure protein
MGDQVVNRTVNIFIQSGEAQKVYDQLIAKQKTLTAELAKNPANAAKIRQELAKLEEPISRAAKKLSGELNPSLKDTQSTATKLRNELGKMSETDAGFGVKVTQLQQANKELDAQKGKLGLLRNAMNSFWQEAKGVAVGVLIGNTLQTMLQTVLGYITGIVTGAAKLSDQLADIQRVTGLTTKEVTQLNASLKTIDTRTSAESLREMAIVAGKLGIAKNDILGFVQATDKLKVALGDELGDINAITTDLGKILNVFEGKINGENITHLGNAIVDLANKGVASGPFLVDFTQRVAGIAKTSNLSLGAVLGLAAGLEESGQKVESSATAISKLLVTIATDLPKAAQIAGAKTKEEVDQFAALFAKAPQEALLKYAAGLQKNKSSFAEIAGSFKDAGEEGARVISTLATLGQKTDFFAKKIDDATGALKGNNEIEEAFRLKNESLGGSLDRLKKSFASIFTSSSFNEGAKTAVNVLNSFVSVVKGSFKFISDYKVVLGSLAVVYTLLIAKINFLALAEVRKNAVTFFSNQLALVQLVREQLIIIANQRKAGAITAATAAQLRYNAVAALGAGPLGVLLIAVAALVIGIDKLIHRQKELSVQQKLAVDVAQRVADATGETVARVKLLEGVLKNENAQYSLKKKALDELIKINPDFANTLKLNKDGTVEGTKAIADYITALKAQAEAQAKYELFVEKIKQRAALINKFRAQTPGSELLTDEELVKKGLKAAQALNKFGELQGDFKSFVDLTGEIDALSVNMDQLQRTAAGVGEAFDSNNGQGMGGKINRTTEEVKKAAESINTLKIKLQQLQKDRDAEIDDKKRSDLNKQIKETEALISKMEGNLQKLSSSEKKAATDTKALAEELRQLATSLLPEDSQRQKFEKDLQALDDKYAKLRERAHGNNQLLLQIQQLYQIERSKIIDKFRTQEEKNLQEALNNQRELEAEAARKRQAFLDGIHPLLDRTIQQNLDRLAAIDRDQAAKHELDFIKAHGKKKLDAELQLLQDEEQQELSKKDLTENEKLLIEEKFRRKRLQAEMDYWSSLLNNISDWAQRGAQIIDLFDQARTNKENAALDRDRALNDKKKANLDKRLKAGLISQAQYDKEVEKLQKQQDAKEKEARLKQFKRDQRAAYVQAGIDGIRGVAKTLAEFGPPVPPNFLGIAAMAATLITTALSLKAISSKEPPTFGRGGKLSGRSHNSGGNAVIDGFGRKIAEVEQDEGIINKFSMRDRTRYTVSGTPSQIASALNARHGGVHWESGATLAPAWKTNKPQSMNFAMIRQAQHYATGGQFQKPAAAASSGDDQQMMMTILAGLMSSVDNLNAQLAAGIVAKTFITDQEAQQDRLNKIRDDATFKP